MTLPEGLIVLVSPPLGLAVDQYKLCVKARMRMLCAAGAGTFAALGVVAFGEGSGAGVGC